MQDDDTAPLVVAYDGSYPSRAAIRRCAELLEGRRAIVATVWEPALGVVALGAPQGVEPGAVPADLETIEEIDRFQREHAVRVAEEGAELARSLGLAAEPHAVPDEVDVADTLIDLAKEHDAALVVAGSHGMSGLRARLLGGVSRKLVDHCDRPVLLVRSR